MNNNNKKNTLDWLKQGNSKFGDCPNLELTLHSTLPYRCNGLDLHLDPLTTQGDNG